MVRELVVEVEGVGYDYVEDGETGLGRVVSVVGERERERGREGGLRCRGLW